MSQVVTCILEKSGKILVLKRSKLVRTYRGRWGGIAGYVEDQEKPLDTAMKEISEEVGLQPDAITLVKKGDPITISDTSEGRAYDWVVHPFLFHIKDKSLIRIDWEHEEYRWVVPSEVRTLETVPGLDVVVTQLLGASDGI
ncbi:MAG TPA: NUDIX pyrophosphatase [Thermoplasmatales archaeon]|nr:NUDIX pyrophosphatase [Thermoplasmatales archaeon]